jgi:hypothetical protein
VGVALHLPASHDALALQFAGRLRDHGALALGLGVGMEVDEQIGGLPQLLGDERIRRRGHEHRPGRIRA